jgi:hypothetical protein
MPSITMSSRRTFLLCTAIGVLASSSAPALLACSRKAEPQKTLPAPTVEPVIPKASADANAALGYEPSWLRQLPDLPVKANEGALVWASAPVPSSDMALVAVYTVEGIRGHRANLIDKLGQKVRNVPGALIHPLGAPGHLKLGEVALCYTWSTGATLGRVAKARDREVQIEVDWAGATRTTSVDHAEPMVKSIAPLGFVSYPKFGHRSKGLVVALSKDKAWVQTSSGHVEIHDRSALAVLAVPEESLETGARVEAYGWTTGFEPGTIARVVEPGVRYAVKLPSSKVEQITFFADLVVPG